MEIVVVGNAKEFGSGRAIEKEMGNGWSHVFVRWPRLVPRVTPQRPA
jgi:hypothetical protein